MWSPVAMSDDLRRAAVVDSGLLSVYDVPSGALAGSVRIPFGLATLAMELYWPASNLFSFFGQVVAVLPVAAAGAWVVVLTSSERQALVSLLRPLRFVRGGVS